MLLLSYYILVYYCILVKDRQGVGPDGSRGGKELIIAVVCRHQSWVGLLTVFPLAACIAPSGTTKAGPQGGGLYVRSSILCLKYIVISNRALPSASERQPRIAIIAYIVLAASWTLLNNN